jgi:hypothetical protein
MQTQLELAGDLGYLDKRLVRELMEQGREVARLINGLVSALGRCRDSEEKKCQVGTQTNSANNANSASSANEGIHQ